MSAFDNCSKCDICSRTYSRVEHLHRHLLTHSPANSFKCHACYKSYKRKDVLRRHLKKCSPQGLEVNRDQRPRISLHHESPPSQQYTSSLTSKLLTYMPPEPHVLHPAMDSSFAFLIQFTKGHNLRTCFATSDMHTRTSSIHRITEPSEKLQALPPVAEKEGFIFENLCRTGLKVSSNISMNTWSQNSSSKCMLAPPGPSATQTMSLKSCELRLALRAVLSDWSIVHELLCCRFFSHPQLDDCLDLYWSMWHPNWPVLHRPTFDAKTIPASLLAAMVLVGACYSSDTQVYNDACYWFDAVEVLAFHNLELDTIGNTSHYQIQSIQAAFLVCVYQGWNGQASAGSRIRRQRFNSIVTVVRQLDIGSAKQTISPNFETFNWMAFVRKEEEIRTLLWVFLLDSAYVIFNNMPPRLIYRELRMGVASCETSYQAATAQDCFNSLQTWFSHNTRPSSISLYSLIKVFFMKELPASALENLAYESFLNLWCVIAAFHVAIFNIDLDIDAESQLRRVKTALDNWASVWMQRRRNDDEKFFDSVIVTDNMSREGKDDDWKRPGFWKNALEYWFLAQLMLKHIMATRESAQAADDLCGIYGFHRDVGCHVRDVIDDTSMDSLHRFLVTSKLHS